MRGRLGAASFERGHQKGMLHREASPGTHSVTMPSRFVLHLLRSREKQYNTGNGTDGVAAAKRTSTKTSFYFLKLVLTKLLDNCFRFFSVILLPLLLRNLVGLRCLASCQGWFSLRACSASRCSVLCSMFAAHLSSRLPCPSAVLMQEIWSAQDLSTLSLCTLRVIICQGEDVVAVALQFFPRD